MTISGTTSFKNAKIVINCAIILILTPNFAQRIQLQVCFLESFVWPRMNIINAHAHYVSCADQSLHGSKQI